VALRPHRGNRFFVSAAEGFLFLSGLVVGIVYGAIARTDGLRAVAGKLLRRSWTLYTLAIWLTFGTALVGTLLGDPSATPFRQNPAEFIIEIVTLQRTFYLVDVLLLYLFAMIVSIGAFALLLRGRWQAVLIVSWALWGLSQYAPAATQIPWPIIDNPVFHFASWQILFFTALVLGYQRQHLAAWFAAHWPRSPLRGQAVWPLGLIFGALVWLSATNAAIFDRFAPGGDAAAVLDSWFLKSQLPFPRLVATALVFGFFWALVSRLWVPLRTTVGPLLLVLGQGALYAYAAHIFLAAIVRAATITIWGESTTGGFPALGAGANTVLQIGTLALLWALTRARFLEDSFAPLGRPPFLRLSVGAGWLRWRPTEALLLTILVGAIATLAFVPNGVATGAARTTTPVIRNEAPSASTVTVPRSIAGRVGAPTGSTAPASAGVPAATPVAAQGDGQLRDGEFFSPILGRTMGYGIYLPPGYDSGTTRYPVLYMLHGRAGHYGEWVVYGLLETAERLIKAKTIPPMIIVLPQGDQSYWSNNLTGERWGDYVVQDVIAHIDATYRTIDRREGRAIGGLSMGGFGALSLGFTHPQLFAAIGAHSPTLRVLDEAPDFLRDAELYAQIDPIELAASLNPATTPKLWIDVGTDDDWLFRTSLLREQLRQRGLRPEYLETTGGHEADYWRQNSGRYLRFYAGALAAPEVP
jgi:enterochelin esterase-like enzyme